MKKFITAITALAMMLTMSVSAFAASPVTQDGGTDSKDVTAKYVDGLTSPDVISVDISWGAMQFTYTEQGTREWNAAEHKYEDKVGTPAWTENGNTVTVANHSNIIVSAGFAFTPLADSGVTGSFTYNKTAENNAVTLESAVGKDKTAPDAVTATLKLGGKVNKANTDFTKVGAVTVTVSKAVVWTPPKM